MSTSPELDRNDRLGLIALFALAACCIVPMLAVLGLTTIVGVSLGWSAALIIGVVAGLACVAMMAAHHRRDGHHHGEVHHG
jgi:amino acid transporter